MVRVGGERGGRGFVGVELGLLCVWVRWKRLLWREGGKGYL
jgi:hypothetical protein